MAPPFLPAGKFLLVTSHRCAWPVCVFLMLPSLSCRRYTNDSKGGIARPQHAGTSFCPCAGMPFPAIIFCSPGQFLLLQVPWISVLLWMYSFTCCLSSLLWWELHQNRDLVVLCTFVSQHLEKYLVPSIWAFSIVCWLNGLMKTHLKRRDPLPPIQLRCYLL